MYESYRKSTFVVPESEVSPPFQISAASQYIATEQMQTSANNKNSTPLPEFSAGKNFAAVIKPIIAVDAAVTKFALPRIASFIAIILSLPSLARSKTIFCW